MLSLFTTGVRELPLSATYTLFFIAPLLITILSVPVLKERVPAAHWWAIGLGFVGVLIALQPRGKDLQEGLVTAGGLAVLGAATCYAVAAIVGRLSSRTDSTESMILWMMVIVALGAGALAAPELGAGGLERRAPAAGAGPDRLRRPARHHRSLPPRPGLGRGPVRIHRPGLGRGAGLGGLANPARITHLAGRGHHHRQRRLHRAPRKTHHRNPRQRPNTPEPAPAAHAAGAATRTAAERGADNAAACTGPPRAATRAAAERGGMQRPQRRAAPSRISPLGGQRPAQRRSVGALLSSATSSRCRYRIASSGTSCDSGSRSGSQAKS